MNTLDLMIGLELTIILLKPIMSLFGLITNILTIIVIRNKNLKKELEKKHYSYMIIHSAANILVCLTQTISLINECQQPFGPFCSSIRKLKFVQYLKLIIVEYFGAFFFGVANFTYVGFAINRLALVGKNHNTLTRLVADATILQFMIISVLISGGFSVIKPLEYSLNIYLFDQKSSFPYFFIGETYAIINTSSILKLTFEVVYNFINYCLFVVFNLIIDLLLLMKIREVTREKAEKFKDQSEKVREKLEKENAKSVREVVNLVVMNSLVNLAFKVPICITTMNDLRITIFKYSLVSNIGYDVVKDVYSFPYTMKFYCFLDKSCELFKSFGDLLLLASVLNSFFFMRRFDRNFKNSLADLISPSSEQEARKKLVLK